eukprot:1953364-Pyramimonas_sp.AAC.1
MDARRVAVVGRHRRQTLYQGSLGGVKLLRGPREMGQTWRVERSASSPDSRRGNKPRRIYSCPSSNWSPPR